MESYYFTKERSIRPCMQWKGKVSSTVVNLQKFMLDRMYKPCYHPSCQANKLLARKTQAMPSFGRTSVTEIAQLKRFALAQVIEYEDYKLIKDAWLGRNGKLYYAGSLDKGHDASCKLLGYASIEACENAGYIHISSCIRHKITFAAIPTRLSKAQHDTLIEYCAAHSIKVPV